MIQWLFAKPRFFRGADEYKGPVDHFPGREGERGATFHVNACENLMETDIANSLDMGRIAKDLEAERRGKVAARGSYFGALELAAEIAARFRVPDGGGRATDPTWNEQRLDGYMAPIT